MVPLRRGCRTGMSRLFEPRLFLRTVASLGLVGLLVWRIDLHQAGIALRDANYLYVLPAAALFFAAKFLVAERWRLMLSKFQDLPRWPMFQILLVSNLANNILP